MVRRGEARRGSGPAGLGEVRLRLGRAGHGWAGLGEVW
jgi:hypothetical protein